MTTPSNSIPLCATRARVASVARSVIAIAACCLHLFGVVPASLAAEAVSERDRNEAPRSESENVYVAGFGLRVSHAVAGDLMAAGCPVSVDRSVGRDANVAGCDVYVRGPIGEDVRAAGGQVKIDGPVGGEILVAGGSVTLTPSAVIAGRAVLAGGEVRVEGKIGKDLKIYAGKVAVQGEVEGNVRVMAGEIDILPSARIKGTLTYTSRDQVKIHPGAQILGEIMRDPMPPDWHEHGRWESRSRGLGIVWLVGLFAAGALMLILFPGFAGAAQARIGTVPWKTLGVGTAVLFAGPLVLIALIATIIGIPIALALLAAYAILLLVGYLTIALYVGERIAGALRKTEITLIWRIVALVVALVLLALLRMIPLLGGFLTLIALLFGAGAVVMQLFVRYRAAA